MKKYRPYKGKNVSDSIATSLALLTAFLLIIAIYASLVNSTNALPPDEEWERTIATISPTQYVPGVSFTLTLEDAMRRIDRHNADVLKQQAELEKEEPPMPEESEPEPELVEEDFTEAIELEPVPEADAPLAVVIEDEISPDYEFEYEVLTLAKMLEGECVAGQVADMIRCSWVVLNRVESANWPNSVTDVIKQPGQFYAYYPTTTPSEETLRIAHEVLTNWYAGDYSSREETCGENVYIFFSASGDGLTNAFRKSY